MKKSIVLWLAMGSGLAHAVAQSFVLMDTDSDGVISRSEAAADDELAEAFARLDVNEDGVLSQFEYRHYRRS